jgi:uncharacterized protein with NRDE domain
MCLILFAYKSHPRYRLVVAANRDEYYRRSARQADFWPDNPEILAGRDLQEGGTWMGVTRSGRFAGLTNYRDPSSYKQQAPSRGHLVYNYLNSDISPEDYIDSLPDGGAAYNGFNLLMGNAEALYYYSNREGFIREVGPGIHGLSNALLDVPWPKVCKGVGTLTSLLQQDALDFEQLFAMMADQEIPDDNYLPETGVGLKWERILAPTFVTSPKYGTRLSTIILIDYHNHIEFRERTFTEGRPDTWHEVCYEI